MMKPMRSGLLLLALSLCLVACADGNSPEAVSRQFWKAIAAEDLRAAKQLATEASAEGVVLPARGRVENLMFGEPRIDADRSLVATGFDRVAEDATVAMQFDTVLIKEGDAWRVDYSETLKSMVGSSFDQLSTALQESVAQMGESVGEAMNEVMVEVVEELNQALQQAAQEMQKAAEELRKEREQQQK